MTLEVAIDKGVDAVYYYDYDNDAGRVGPNNTDSLSVTYFVPGQYDVTVYANDVNNTFQVCLYK